MLEGAGTFLFVEFDGNASVKKRTAIRIEQLADKKVRPRGRLDFAMDVDSGREARPQFSWPLAFACENFKRGVEFKIATNFVAQDNANGIAGRAEDERKGDA